MAGVASAAAGITPSHADAAESPDVVMIIRHAEKALDSGAPYGVTEAGTTNTGSLIVRGWVRAGALVNGFTHPGPWNVPVPTAIYASRPGVVSELRALQTITPLARRLNLTPNVTFRRGDEAGLATELLAEKGARLVAWEHHSIPAIVANLGTVTPSPAASWHDERYDIIWCFERVAHDSWHFREIPQQLLVGDLGIV